MVSAKSRDFLSESGFDFGYSQHNIFYWIRIQLYWMHSIFWQQSQIMHVCAVHIKINISSDCEAEIPAMAIDTHADRWEHTSLFR